MVPVGVSARHIHLSQEHLEILFGTHYQLTILKDLSQPGQFAANETVTIVGPKGSFNKVRILGPVRGNTQLEISKTDSFKLGIQAPVRQSGNTEGTPGVKIVGSAGEVTIQEGVIIAARHIHFHTQDALKWGIENNQKLSVKCKGERPLIFEDVIARISSNFKLDMHLDTDEANAAGIKSGDVVEIIG